MIVHFEDECELSVLGLHENAVRLIGASVSVKVCELPFRLAANTAAVLMLTAVALAENPVVAAPAATATDEGTKRLAVPLLNATVAQPLGAGADKPTVQDADPGVGMTAGEQASLRS